MGFTAIRGLACFLLSAGTALAIDLDLDNNDSIIGAGQIIVEHALAIYNQDADEPGWIPGLLPTDYSDPQGNYYYWHAAVMFDTLIEWWALTGDASLVDAITTGVSHQVGPDMNFLPPNQSLSLSNDEHSYWAAAAMTAAERSLPQSSSLNVTWLQLAQNVFESQVTRWNDPEACGGGLRWQLFTFNDGYNYKDTASTLSFASLAARLARYTGNSTYSDWTLRAVTWLFDVGYISSGNDGSAVAIYNGAYDTDNCTDIDRFEWTQNTGLALLAGAYASNSTQGEEWTSNLIQIGRAIANDTFATSYTSGDGPQPAALQEVACVPNGECNSDNRFMQASLVRGLARVRELTLDSNVTSGMDASVIGTTHTNINDILQISARGAAAQCSGGVDRNVCGLDWRASEYDGFEGVGEDVSALEVLIALLPAKTLATADMPAQNSTNGGGGRGGTDDESESSGGDANGNSSGASSLPMPVVCGTTLVLLGALAVLL